MPTLAIIGAGNHSRLHHGPSVTALRDRLGRVAIADLNLELAQRYAREFDLDGAYSDAARMLETEKPDALIVVTPEAITDRVVRELLPYRLPMLVEKPFGENVPQTEALCRLCRDGNARIMISFNRRFAPACRTLCGWLRTRFAGRRPQHLRAAILRHERLEKSFVTATSIHMIDTVNLLAGCAPTEVRVQVQDAPQGRPGAISASLVFPGGMTGEILIHPDCGHLAEEYEAFGSGYHLRADFFTGAQAFENGERVARYDLPPDMPREEREGAVDELAAYLDALETGAAFSPAPEDALAAARIAHEIESAILAHHPAQHEETTECRS